MAVEHQTTSVEPLRLPANWRDLKLVERFAALRDSPHLVRGRVLDNVTVDCRMCTIANVAAGYALQFCPPGREDGSFSFRVLQGRSVYGKLEILSSDSHPYDRIFVLSGTSSRFATQKGPGGLTEFELAYAASLLETIYNHCWPAQLGRHFDVYAVLADRAAAGPGG